MSSEQSSNDRSNGEFSCRLCGDRIPTVDAMRIHLRICASKTDQCPYCKKFISLSIFAYHVNNYCTDPDLYVSNDQVETNNPKKFETFFAKAAHIPSTLGGACYQPEIDHVIDKLQFNIIVMGSPRVGKSSLINALCDGNQAEVSASLNSCTDKITCYTLEDDQQRHPNIKPFKINFYDSPGIERWQNNAGTMKMIELIEKTNPLCVIYCASSGSFAKLDQLHSVLEYCKSKEIFCALVCTNMWSGNNRRKVMEEFEKQLEVFGDRIEKISSQIHSGDKHQVIFFGTGALCTMINSKEYSDRELLGNRVKPVQGIDELIHGIMESLDQEKLLGWCYAVLYRRSYWEIIKQKVGGFFRLRFENLHDLVASSHERTATNFAAYFLKLLELRKKT